jgi:hypothetical protein
MSPGSAITAGRENRQRPKGYADWRPHTTTRVLLAHVDDVLDRYRDHLPLSVRQIFYALVAAGVIAKDEKAYARLCEHLNRARRARIVPFDAIRDDGVTVMSNVTYNGISDFDDETARRIRAYCRDRQAGQPVRMELWCEAAGMMPQLHRVASPYSVPVYSASGFSSLSAVRSVVDRALSRDVPTVVLHVGDLDPSGVAIYRSLIDDAARFVRVDRVLHTIDLIGERVALTDEHVARYDLPRDPVKATDGRGAGWDFTCQCEALPPDVLASLIDQAIRHRLDDDVLSAVLDQEQAERADLLALPRGVRE